MVNLAAIKKAEADIASAKNQLVTAVKSTFVPGTKVFVKGPRGEKETEVVEAVGEDLMVKTSSGVMKRHYSTLRTE